MTAHNAAGRDNRPRLFWWKVFVTSIVSVLFIVSVVANVVLYYSSIFVRTSDATESHREHESRLDPEVAVHPRAREIARHGCMVVTETTGVVCFDSVATVIPLLADMPHLQHVTIINQLLGSNIDSIATLKHLESLRIADCRLGKTRVRFLTKVPSLSTLVVDSSDVCDDDLMAISQIKGLVTLDLSFNERITSNGIRCLRNVSGLTKLSLFSTQVAELDFLKNMRNLTVLELPNTPVGDEDLLEVVQLQQLKELNIAGTNVTDAGLRTLGQVTSLRMLDIRCPKLTPDAVSRLRQQLPNCTVLYR